MARWRTLPNRYVPQACRCSSGSVPGDHTSDAVMQMQRTISAGQLHQLSLDIDRALAKLDDGNYGICDACGEAIAQERLEALPWATLCVRCKATASRQV